MILEDVFPFFIKESALTSSTTHIVLDPSSSIDLHMHTNYSDGRWPAQQLIDYLVEEHFDLVAVTDHDRVDKVAEIQALGAEKHLPILAGVEMSTQWNGHMAHLLCYGFDPVQNYLQSVTTKVAQLQLENTHAVNAELQSQGYAFPRQEIVLAQNDGKLRLPSDNIRLLLEHGHAANYRAGLQLIEKAGFHSIMADMAETVDAAHRSGAFCLIAHPGRRERGFTFYDPALLDQLRIDVPIDGIEIYHPYHTPDVIETYLDYVQKHDLLFSTGSDSHGIPGRMPKKHRAEISKKLLERLGVTLTSSGTSQSL
ncbi:MAG: PHP domain-containing protein [Ktedonobacteraceae bacterium]|nr:PHP domain-containing protein [Ktedonobacteraceae bacterium]